MLHRLEQVLPHTLSKVPQAASKSINIDSGLGLLRQQTTLSLGGMVHRQVDELTLESTVPGSWCIQTPPRWSQLVRNKEQGTPKLSGLGMFNP